MRSIEDVYNDVLKAIENAPADYGVDYILIGEDFDICLQVYKTTEGNNSLHLQLYGQYHGKRRARKCDYRIQKDILYAVTYLVNCAIRLSINTNEKDV